MMMSLKKEMVALAQQQNNYVYIVRCRDQTLYTGWTNQLEKRIEAHNAGKGAKYTKARRPVELVYFETFEHKSEALKREYQIKQLKRFASLNIVSLYEAFSYDKFHFLIMETYWSWVVIGGTSLSD